MGLKDLNVIPCLQSRIEEWQMSPKMLKTDKINRSILSYSSLGVLVVGIIIASLGTVPLYHNLKRDQEKDLKILLKTRIETVEEYLSRSKAIARQITSRTMIRERLEEYNSGKIKLDALRKFTDPKLKDAMDLSDWIAGISRLDRLNRLVAQVGLPARGRLLSVPKGSKGLFVRAPVMLGHKTCIVIGAPIVSKSGLRDGTDIVIFKAGHLERIVEDYSGLNGDGEVTLGKIEYDRVRLFFPLRRNGKGFGTEIPQDSVIGAAIGRGARGESGMVSEGKKVVAYSPVKGSNWGIAVIRSKAALYAPVYRSIGIMAGAMGFLLVCGAVGMVFLLRPLTGALQDELLGHKMAEVALRESEERFRNLVETTSDMVWETDKEGLYTYVSPAVSFLLGYEPEEAVGRTPFDFMPPEESERVGKVFRSLMAEHKPIRYLENINLQKKGRPVVLETCGVPFFDADGAFEGYRGVDRDITERKDAEDQIRRLNEDLEQRIKERTAELEEKNRELERMNRLFVGRELRMMELKETIKSLKESGGIKDEA